MSSLDKVLKSRVVCVLSLLLGVGGISFGIWSHWASIESPLLVMHDSGQRVTIIDKDRPTGMSVRFNDLPIENESVIALSVTLMNAGRRPIRPEDVLAPVRLVIGPDARILVAEITDSSREVIEFRIADTEGEFEKGVVPIAWRILEEDDYATLSIVFVGSADARCGISGSIVGQRQLVAKYGRNPKHHWTLDETVGIILFTLITPVFLFGIVMLVRDQVRVFRRLGWRKTARVYTRSGIRKSLAIILVVFLFMAMIILLAIPLSKLLNYIL